MSDDQYNPFADPKQLLRAGDESSIVLEQNPRPNPSNQTAGTEAVQQPSLAQKPSSPCLPPETPPITYLRRPTVSSNTSVQRNQYEDFETIDWLKDLARDRCRHRLLHANRNSFWDSAKVYLESGSGWLCVLVVGVITGHVAFVIDVGTTWMSDLKEGVCLEAFWLNRPQCCWSSNFTDGHCPQWFTWSRLFIGKEPITEYPDGFFVGYMLYIIWAVFFVTLCVLLVRMFAPYACGSGIPEIKTILSGFIIHGYLGKWTLLIKTVGMVLGVAAGLSLGKEGPMVHMASCVGNIVSHFFPKYGGNEAKKREILSASAAAGVAVAFGAPIGGVLFSLEEASYYFPMKTMFRSFFCAMVSANVLRMLNPYGDDHMIMFHVDYRAQWHVLELGIFAFLGMLGGIFGTLFNRANLYICRLRKTTRWGKYPVREVVLVGLVTALVSYPHAYLRMNTSELIRILVSNCHPGDEYSICDYQRNLTTSSQYAVLGNYPAGPSMSTGMALLTVTLFVKYLLTVFTFGVKVPTGLFIPSLAAGAIMGRMMGIGVEQVLVAHASHPTVIRLCKSSQPCVHPGLYAMVGAAATLGGVTRMTISLVVVMLELTGGLNYIIPLMVAAMVSKWTGDLFTNGSIYDGHILLNDYPYLSSHYELSHTSIAADVMQPRTFPPLTVTQDSMTLKQLKHLLDTSKVQGFPIVTSREYQYLVGWVLRRDILWALEQEEKANGVQSEDAVVTFSSQVSRSYNDGDAATLDLRHIVDLAPITVTDQTPMETLLDIFRKLGLRHVLVTHHGRILGILTRKDVLKHVLKASGHHA